MSILIKGMEMPINCDSCPCYYETEGAWRNECEVLGREHYLTEERPSWCPLVEIPPHGRLRKRIVYRGEVYNAIEAARVNALDGILSDRYKDGFHDGLKRALEILANVEDAPTIIEAEEGE